MSTRLIDAACCDIVCGDIAGYAPGPSGMLAHIAITSQFGTRLAWIECDDLIITH